MMNNRYFCLSVFVAAISFGVVAQENDPSLQKLKTQLAELQMKVQKLENKRTSTSNTTERADPKNVKMYASLRPTFGRLDDGEEYWDVKDALSNAGVKSTFEFIPGWTAILHGEWSVDLSNNGDFGKARQVYVALDSPYGQVGIGKQRPAQYLFIAEYVDIFDHGNSPFAYDPESLFFVNNLLTYQLKLGDVTWVLVSQFNGKEGNNNSDLFNGGFSYDKDDLHIAMTYASEDKYDDDVKLGKDEIFAGSLAYTFANNIYAAASYQAKTYDRSGGDRDGHTFDFSVAYPIGEYYKVKSGVFSFVDGIKTNDSLDYSGFNLTFEWLPADGLRYHVEYLTKNFDHRSDLHSISIGFRYDYSRTW